MTFGKLIEILKKKEYGIAYLLEVSIYDFEKHVNKPCDDDFEFISGFLWALELSGLISSCVRDDLISQMIRYDGSGSLLDIDKEG